MPTPTESHIVQEAMDLFQRLYSEDGNQTITDCVRQAIQYAVEATIKEMY